MEKVKWSKGNDYASRADIKYGRDTMRADILAIVRQCLVADPTLSKLVKAIEGLK